MEIRSVKMIDSFAWDRLVQDTYGRVYCYQQQNGCRDRGTFELTIPASVEEGTEGSVDFLIWLERDPKEPIPHQEHDFELEIFWEREFYPDIQSIANDLHSKGLIEADEYIINIDW